MTKCNHKPNFGRYVEGCPRCEERKNGSEQEKTPPLGHLRVRAIRQGYYGNGPDGNITRYPGDVFTLTPYEVALINVRTQQREKDEGGKAMTHLLSVEEQFSENWMEIVPDETEETRTSGQQAVNQQIAELKGI